MEQPNKMNTEKPHNPKAVDATLLDLFAEAALHMSGPYHDQAQSISASEGITPMAVHAIWAFDQAEAMLMEREKRIQLHDESMSESDERYCDMVARKIESDNLLVEVSLALPAESELRLKVASYFQRQ